MKKYNFKKVTYYFIMTLLVGVYSCAVNDDYKKFVEEGEFSYTGKIDSLKILPGRNRVKVEGLIISDPKVTELRVYWNTKKDSAVVPVNRTSGVDAVSTIIENLPENIYNFEVKTFDANGNSSISQNVTASTYGERYQASLVNRTVISSIPDGSELTINFADMDRSSGVIGTEVVYTSSLDELEKTIFVDIDDFSLVILDYKIGTSLSYRTTFKPTKTAIDTFYTDYAAIQPRPTPVLKNASQPFVYDTVAGLVGGRWGTLAGPWITNDAAKTHSGVGGYDNGCCAGREKTMNLECGWGSPNYTNAKIYQVTTADANVNYQLRFTTVTSNFSANDAVGAYLVIALGSGLPDIGNVTSAPEVIAYKKIGGIDGGTLTVDFSISQISQISVGIVATQSGEKYCNVKSWQIIKL